MLVAVVLLFITTQGVETMNESMTYKVLTRSSPEPQLAQQRNLHIGEPYRITISGINPVDSMTFDGELEQLAVFTDDAGFTIDRLVLSNGIATIDRNGERRLFAREEIAVVNPYNEVGSRLIRFGRLLDKQGFEAVRERLQRRV